MNLVLAIFFMMTSRASAQVAPQVPEAATLVLAQTYEADEDRVFLGQVASCGGSTRLCEEAYGIDLGASPAPGKTATFAVEKLRQLLAKEWPEAKVTVEATKPLKIVSRGQAIDEEMLLGALRDRLVDGLVVTDTFAVEVGKLQVPVGLVVRPGDYRLEFPDLTDEALASEDWVRRHLVGNQRLEVVCVPLDAPERASPAASFTVGATLTLKERLPVALRNLARGDMLRAEDLEDRMVERGRGMQKVVTEVKYLAGRRVTRGIGVGDPIPVGAVEVADVVKRGQLVRLEMRGRGVEVSGRVQVLAGAGYGEAVDAVYPATKKKIRVRVVDGDTVEYLF